MWQVLRLVKRFALYRTRCRCSSCQAHASNLSSFTADVRNSHGDRKCDLCHSPIMGLRSRCIHCPSFSSCSACEVKVADSHPPDHVFKILEPLVRKADGTLEYNPNTEAEDEGAAALRIVCCWAAVSLHESRSHQHLLHMTQSEHVQYQHVY